MPLTDIGRVKDLYEPKMDPSRDAALGVCVDAATDWVERESGLYLTRPTAAYVERLDGEQASRSGSDDCLLFGSRHRPVTHLTPDFVTVTEDGVSLSLSLGYSTTAEIILEGANSLEGTTRMTRRSGAWSNAEAQNVAVTYFYGYANLAAVPPMISLLASEVAWLLWKSQSWVGQTAIAAEGQSVSWEKGLSPMSQRMLAYLKRLANA